MGVYSISKPTAVTRGIRSLLARSSWRRARFQYRTPVFGEFGWRIAKISRAAASNEWLANGLSVHRGACRRQSALGRPRGSSGPVAAIDVRQRAS